MKKNGLALSDPAIAGESNGFTLIEIMITISIIAVLAAVSISVFSNVQKSNRDQKRIRDLQSIKQALELYRSDNGAYPSVKDDLMTKYLAAWPSDPVVSQSYFYQKTSTEFIICAKKEGNMADFPPCGAGNIGLQSD